MLITKVWESRTHATGFDPDCPAQLCHERAPHAESLAPAHKHRVLWNLLLHRARVSVRMEVGGSSAMEVVKIIKDSRLGSGHGGGEDHQEFKDGKRRMPTEFSAGGVDLNNFAREFGCAKLSMTQHLLYVSLMACIETCVWFDLCFFDLRLDNPIKLN